MSYNIFFIPKQEIKLIGEENYIYGFPTNNGTKKISKEISNIITTNNLEIIGIDLGCGDGKLIDYFNKNIKNSLWHGIELSATRIDLSDYKNNNYIIEGNLLNLDYSDYNFIFTNNVCFDDDLCEKLEHKILSEFIGHFIFSKKITNINLYKNAIFLTSFIAETNWDKSHEFYIYYKN